MKCARRVDPQAVAAAFASCPETAPRFRTIESHMSAVSTTPGKPRFIKQLAALFSLLALAPPPPLAVYGPRLIRSNPRPRTRDIGFAWLGAGARGTFFGRSSRYAGLVLMGINRWGTFCTGGTHLGSILFGLGFRGSGASLFGGNSA